MNIEMEYYNSENIKSTRHYDNDHNYHRKDGPAYILYFINGNLACEYYFIRNRLHREDGPAVILYNENGQIYSQEYYYDNERYDEFEYWILVASSK